MKVYLKIIFSMCFSFLAMANDLPTNGFIEKFKKENIEFNKTVEDKEIEDFLIRSLKYAPTKLEEFLNFSGEEKKGVIDNIRESHEKQFIKIPTLRGLSAKELNQLDQVFEYQAKAMEEVAVAVETIEGLKDKELESILSECVNVSTSDTFKSGKIFGDDIPKEFSFLNPEFIYIGTSSSRIFLHKGVGKGIGLSCQKDAEGLWKLYSFNEYQSWDLKAL